MSHWKLNLPVIALLWVIVAMTAPCFCTQASAQATADGQVIRSFNSDVFVTKDGQLDVNETILMDFGSNQKHGIYRSIPVRYTTKHGVLQTPTHLLDVTADGANATYQASDDHNNLFIRIGDSNRLIQGEHTYKVHYRVTRAINVFDNQPEIYWNATGDESPFPIEQATAQFWLPKGVSVTQVEAKCFRGSRGSKDLGSFTKENDLIRFQTSDLAPMQGLTFVLRLPAGAIAVENNNTNNELYWWLADWWPAIFTPWLALALVLANWWINGRDPANAYIAGVDWNPPKELTPAEVGTLIDEQCDVADIVSTLVDLAARGYLKIKQMKTEKFFFSSTDYQFTKLEPPEGATPFKPHERIFFTAVFSTGDVVNLSSLKNSFYVNIPTIRDRIYDSLTAGAYFVKGPEKVRSFYRTAGTVGMLIGVLMTFKAAPWAVGIGLSGFIVFCSSQVMPARTRKGVDACRQAVGFQRFVQKAEKERIRILAKEDPTIFGRLLPYAMVLGAADQWAEAFHDLLTQPPDWFEPYNYHSNGFVFSSTNFVNDLGDGMRTCATTFVSTPAPVSSSSGYEGGAGGFSGFSDGGGFSGGGFGGGGTGSW